MKYEQSSARSRHERKCWIFCWIYLFQFNEAICTSKFPACFKFANVTLVFKKGSRNQKDNYRPISILPSKIFKKLICKQLSSHFDNALWKFQCDFRRSYSPQHFLLLMIDKWKKAVDNNKVLGILLTNLSKAFDCMSWFTFSKIGCLLSVFSCFKNYTGLSDRNGIRTHNHLVRNQTLKHLAKQAIVVKCLSVHLWIKWLWVRIRLLSFKLQI